MIKPNTLLNIDCLDGMQDIPDGAIDMVLSDWPYGTTQCSWDIPLDLPEVWKQLGRIVKPNGAIVLFSAQPFTTDLINSNRKMFRYEIIWQKTQAQGFLNANRAPLRAHENILVFYKRLPTYNPQKTRVDRKDIGRVRVENPMRSKQYREMQRTEYVEQGLRYPTDVVEFSNWNGSLFGNTKNAAKHPTQKPVPLLEYLIKTYTNPGDTVLDNCAGSGTTGEACINTDRNYILMEKDAAIYDTARQRLERVTRAAPEMQINLF